MPRRCVFFRSVDVTGRKDALKNSHHDLFVKLRTLREMRDMSKVWNIKGIRSALGIIADQLWRLDLRKSFVGEKLTKCADDMRLHRKNCPLLWLTHRKRQVVQIGVDIKFRAKRERKFHGPSQYGDLHCLKLYGAYHP